MPCSVLHVYLEVYEEPMTDFREGSGNQHYINTNEILQNDKKSPYLVLVS